jgi:hypothetical protein
MKTFLLIIFGAIIISVVAKDRASFRALELILSSEQMTREYINLKSIIPGYSTWKLTKVRREMSEQFKAENNPK